MWEIFKEEISSLRSWLNNHKIVKRSIFIIAILAIIVGSIAGIYQATFGKPIISFFESKNNNTSVVEPTLQTDLKNYTLKLCQDIDTFMANRMQNQPNIENYHWNMSAYSKAYYNYDAETKSLFIKYFSVKIAGCYYEFEKRGYSIDSNLISEVNNPVNTPEISIEIVPSLESLAHQL